jgi:alpha-tubulin suppressor-like RCC1 family protein
VDLGCESGVGRVCASGLVCVADRCEQSCTDRSDCPSDADCRSASSGGVMFCVGPDGEVDAGIADADVDAGPSCAIVDMCLLASSAACARDCTGRVWCWGREHGGLLGIGEDVDRVVTTPSSVVDVAGTPIANVDALACAEGFACAHVAPDAAQHARHVLCWGYDGTGAIPSSRSASASDLFAPYVADSVALSASLHHACMLDRSDGSVRCFGVNDAAIDPTMAPTTAFQTPTAPLQGMLGPVDTIRVAANGACALMRSGAVQCWGENDFGQAGHEPVDTTPGVVEPSVGATTVMSSGGALHDVAFLTVGLKHGAVLAHAGGSGPLSLLTWGGNDFGELGETLEWTGEPCDEHVAASPVCRAIAATPSNAPTFLAIASDGFAITSCGIEASTHHVLCWGSNLHAHAGTTGDNVVLPTGMPVLRAVDGAPLDDAQDVFVGAQNACATRSDGSLWCWGANADGQLARAVDDADHYAVEIPFPFR